ncbi:FAD-dependent oxidoreductase [Pendulispora albinea]|uniref:FAD-dependent oxidoreductase n=1 Tax=Pendulispora albinea TaxID=2741071 RepID=A0ABZ2M3N2_9BACT
MTAHPDTATAPSDGQGPELHLGIPGFSYEDLYDPARLAELHAIFDLDFAQRAPEAYAQFDAYRRVRGEGMTPEQKSEALLAAAPHVSAFVGRLFGVEKELAVLRDQIASRGPLWQFKHEFAKKRVLGPSAGKAWKALGYDSERAANVSRLALTTVLGGNGPLEADEELATARAVLALFEIDDTARKVKKGGGATWTDELRDRAHAVAEALRGAGLAGEPSANLDDAALVAHALDAIEAYLASRYADHHDPVSDWPSLHQPKNLDYANLVQLRRPEPDMPELFVGPSHERRERGSFTLTDRRFNARQAEQEINYCIFCHNRDKDSCSKGLLDPKQHVIKKNPLGVKLDGCPLEEKISEMHTVRGQGDPLGALALVTIDNPMCPGTGHRICNDCMKACIFQKQEPVNIPQIETRVLTEVLDLPWGLEIYGFLTRFNPLNVFRPHIKPYCGKNVLVVGLGPAGYTLAHHLACEGFGVVAVDGLKIEPLPADIIGRGRSAPVPVHDFQKLYGELDERILLGFGGVSEYGITVRWDKNFLTVVYVTLARHRNLRIYGGIRFGGTLTLDDAWDLGIDHVAIAAGAGKPTIIDMKNNLSRGIRKASDFLMALQLTGAYKKSSIANLQIQLPAVVIGGGLTAIDTATELLAYYVIQIEKTRERFEQLGRDRTADELRSMFDAEEWELLQQHLLHARELAEEKALAQKENREARVQQLCDKWGGVSLVYRKTLQDSPAYRLNHEEVEKSLEEGVRYIENMSPVEAVLDERRHVRAIQFKRKDGSLVELPARTVCVAAGTNPNVTYEREYEGTFELDERQYFFKAHYATVDAAGKVTLHPIQAGAAAAVNGGGAPAPKIGFFTSYSKDNHTVTFYGDNHPHYAGSVVRAMASAKDGYRHVVALFPDIQRLDAAAQPERDRALAATFERLDRELIAQVVGVNRLTQTIVEVVVRAPLAARKFKPGQFYRLQNFETFAPIVDNTRLAMEGLALTGAWVDEQKGEMGTIVLEMGGSSRLCAALRPGEPVVLMGPTGTPTEIAHGETVLLCGGGLGNAVLFSIARAFKALGSKVLYFAGYKRGEDLFKQDDIERYTDQVIWCTDMGKTIEPRRPQDRQFRGNIVEGMRAYAEGLLGGVDIPLSTVNRIIAIGSDRMMAAVKEARHGVLAPKLNPVHRAIASINSPMQCMMKEVCAQCLQKHVDPVTKKETVVFSCFNQDQEIDSVDFAHLRERLRINSMQEKLADAWLMRLLAKKPDLLRV